MAEPTEAAGTVLANMIRPMSRMLEGIVRDQIGPEAAHDAERVRFCVASVIGQCVFYRNCEAMLMRLYPEHRLDAAAIGRLADHIAGLCAAGFQACRSPAPPAAAAPAPRRGGRPRAGAGRSSSGELK